MHGRDEGMRTRAGRGEVDALEARTDQILVPVTVERLQEFEVALRSLDRDDVLRGREVSGRRRKRWKVRDERRRDA